MIIDVSYFEVSKSDFVSRNLIWYKSNLSEHLTLPDTFILLAGVLLEYRTSRSTGTSYVPFACVERFAQFFSL